MPVVSSHNRFEEDLKKCYCMGRNCDFNCDIATFCEPIVNELLREPYIKNFESAFIEQNTISGVLKGAHGEYCRMFKDNADEMDGHIGFIKNSVFRSAVVMHFIYCCTMGIFKSCRNRMLHQFLIDPMGQIIPENGDFIHKIVTNPRFHFARVICSSLRILQHEIDRVEHVRNCIHEFISFMDLQYPQVQMTNHSLMFKVYIEKRVDLRSALKQHTFMWKTYQVWHLKNLNFLLTTERLIACNLFKLVRMRDMHVLALENWESFANIPNPMHPRNFENLFFKP